MDLPGHIGYSLLGDESISFVRHPQTFLSSKIRRYGPIFVTRLGNRPAVLVTSNGGVEELLNERWMDFQWGYKEYFYDLFSDSLPFLDGKEWEKSRGILASFTTDCRQDYCDKCRKVICEYYEQLDISSPLLMYQMFKELATRLSIFLFLGVDPDDLLFKELSELMSLHWRGIISLPVNITIPFFSIQSGRSKALLAKERLLEIIREKISTSHAASGLTECMEEGQIANNLLVFVSALIPKALGSLLTSLVMELSKPDQAQWKQCHSNGADLEDVLLEVQRLWPPFAGGFRVSRKESQIGGYRIPEGYATGYISFFANRDKEVFPEPEKFKPSRWRKENAGDRDRIWTFGGGPRCCIGKHLVPGLLAVCSQTFLELFDFEVLPGQDLDYKLFPVARPKSDIKVHLKKVKTSFH